REEDEVPRRGDGARGFDARAPVLGADVVERLERLERGLSVAHAAERRAMAEARRRIDQGGHLERRVLREGERGPAERLVGRADPPTRRLDERALAVGF